MITQGKWLVMGNQRNGHFDYVLPMADNDDFQDNARLIAAAPELLAACKDGEKFLDCLLAGNGMSETQLRMMSENRMAFRRVLDEAIAKAEKT